MLKYTLTHIRVISIIFSILMTVIYITENNCECYAVTFQNKGWIKVQKFHDESLDENIIYTVNPMETFFG